MIIANGAITNLSVVSGIERVPFRFPRDERRDVGTDTRGPIIKD
jgi:hypothetical protein